MQLNGDSNCTFGPTDHIMTTATLWNGSMAVYLCLLHIGSDIEERDVVFASIQLHDEPSADDVSEGIVIEEDSNEVVVYEDDDDDENFAGMQFVTEQIVTEQLMSIKSYSVNCKYSCILHIIIVVIVIVIKWRVIRLHNVTTRALNNVQMFSRLCSMSVIIGIREQVGLEVTVECRDFVLHVNTMALLSYLI